MPNNPYADATANKPTLDRMTHLEKSYNGRNMAVRGFFPSIFVPTAKPPPQEAISFPPEGRNQSEQGRASRS